MNNAGPLSCCSSWNLLTHHLVYYASYDEDFDLVVNPNMKSIYMSASVIVPYMEERGRGGVFVQIASTAGIRPDPVLPGTILRRLQPPAQRRLWQWNVPGQDPVQCRLLCGGKYCNVSKSLCFSS
jgi:NAD(P)-dependent dehydrogenase (short-subunit alcohol dehydrogenase family)